MTMDLLLASFGSAGDLICFAILDPLLPAFLLWPGFEPVSSSTPFAALVDCVSVVAQLAADLGGAGFDDQLEFHL